MNTNERPNKTVFSKDHCEKIRQSRIGKKHSPETIAKIKATKTATEQRKKKTRSAIE